MIEKIPYLKDLGVTVVELLPVHQFDPQERNYWGYMTLHFFSPHQAYAHGGAFEEFRSMVQALHEAGIEVWLDVVYNHTTEGDNTGPTYSYRGVDNSSYYLLTPDRRHYINDTGCGNTVRTGHPSARVLVLESLRFWARTVGVDGFRFDLASIFSRAADGTVNVHEASLVSELSLLARLFNVRLVAEAWDIGRYQLGRGFPGIGWLQWNGRFRDDVRSFVRNHLARLGASGKQPRSLRFFKLMIAFRKSHPCIGRPTFWRDDVSWYGVDGPVDFGHESRCLAFCFAAHRLATAICT